MSDICSWVAGDSSGVSAICACDASIGVTVNYTSQIHASDNSADTIFLRCDRTLICTGTDDSTCLIDKILWGISLCLDVVLWVKVIFNSHGASDTTDIDIPIHDTPINTEGCLAIRLFTGVLIWDILNVFFFLRIFFQCIFYCICYGKDLIGHRLYIIIDLLVFTRNGAVDKGQNIGDLCHRIIESFSWGVKILIQLCKGKLFLLC